jgi:hypothetical protein
MRLVIFDGHKFAEDVAGELEDRNSRQRCLRATGVSAGTLNRIIDGHSVKDITTILSLCAYFSFSIKDYVRV